MSSPNQFKPLGSDDLQLRVNVRPDNWTNPTPRGRYNLVVIGAGTAGLVAAAGAAGLGAKVALVERHLMGGDCLNVGCVPSKALIGSARQVAAIGRSSQFGIRAGDFGVDFPDVMQRMRRLRASISRHDSAQRFSQLGVDVYFGQGTFTGRDTIDVCGQTLHFKKAVIATGTRPAEPPIPGLTNAGYLTNENLFSITELPRRLIVVGGGPIGCEMAQSFARFGAQVTLVELSGRILAGEEHDAAQIVQRCLEHDGVRCLLTAKVIRVASDGTGKVVVVRHNGEEKLLVADEILISTGRVPNLDGLGLEAAGVRSHPGQGIVVDDRLQTSNRIIYAAGDICTPYRFTHSADFLARTAIRNALFLGRAKASALIIPWCTYTSPEVAHVGIYPKEAAERGVEINVYTQPLSAVDRAVLDGQESGYVRVITPKRSDRVLGATVVAAHAGELIGEIVMAMKHKIGLAKIASVIHPYPTQSEAIRKLGDQYNRTRLTPIVRSLSGAWLRWTR